MTAPREGRRQKCVLHGLAGRRRFGSTSGASDCQVRKPDETDARPLRLGARRRGAVESGFGGAQGG